MEIDIYIVIDFLNNCTEFRNKENFHNLEENIEVDISGIPPEIESFIKNTTNPEFKDKLKGFNPSISNEEFELLGEKYNKIRLEIGAQSSESDSYTSNYEEKKLVDYFESILGMNNFTVSKTNDKISLVLDSDEKLYESIEEKHKWTTDRMVESFSKRFEFPEEKIKVVNSLSDYIKFISEVAEEMDDIGLESFVSRGQKDCSFPLLPSLMRRKSKQTKISKLEKDLQTRFQTKISYYDNTVLSRVENRTEISSELILTYGQHFGLPTRYLDFTESHLLALLFALEEYDHSNPAVVYLINAKSYNYKTTGEEKKFIEVNSSKTSDDSYFIKPHDTNKRVHFQNGCFLKCSNNFNEDNEDYRELFNHASVVLIDSAYKKQILIEMFNMGITFESIYPDIDNVVKNIKFKEEIK
ncbi:FRG domain-containing protein [Streptococcus suis]|nr:FRG domain-containing protein [Streptococcus suis]